MDQKRYRQQGGDENVNISIQQLILLGYNLFPFVEKFEVKDFKVY